MRQLKLSKQFTERHYLVSELLRMVQFSIVPVIKKQQPGTMETKTFENEEEMIRLRNSCLEDFHTVLLKMSLDNRYKSDQDQSRIIMLFSPFVGFVTRNLRELNFEAISSLDWSTSEIKRKDSMKSAISSTITTKDSDPRDESKALKTFLRCFLHIVNHVPSETLKVSRTRNFKNLFLGILAKLLPS